MPLITISRQYGSGGSEVAERVATTLGWRLYDNAVVDEVARRLGMSTEEVSAREERVPSFAERMASAMALGVPEVMPTVADLTTLDSEERIVATTKASCSRQVLPWLAAMLWITSIEAPRDSGSVSLIVAGPGRGVPHFP